MKNVTITALLLATSISSAVFAASTPIESSTYTISVRNGGMTTMFLAGAPAKGSFYAQFSPGVVSSHYTAACSPISCTQTGSQQYPSYKTNSPIAYGQTENFAITVSQGPSFDPSLTKLFVFDMNLYTNKEPSGWFYVAGFGAQAGSGGLPTHILVDTGSAFSRYYEGTCRSQISAQWCE